MGSFSVVHWLVLIVVCVFWVVPFWLILRKAGFNGAWALTAPVLGFVLLWVLALVPWKDRENDRV